MIERLPSCYKASRLIAFVCLSACQPEFQACT